MVFRGPFKVELCGFVFSTIYHSYKHSSGWRCFFLYIFKVLIMMDHLRCRRIYLKLAEKRRYKLPILPYDTA